MHRRSGAPAALPAILLVLMLCLALLHTTGAARPALAATAADLQIVGIAAPTSAVPGQIVTYTITYRNNGPGTVPAAVISDTLPASLGSITFSSLPAVSATSGPPAYVFQVGDLASGASGTITITATLATTVTAGSLITNSATIDAPGLSDINVSNNSASASITVVEPQLSTVTTLLTASTGIDAGDSVRYQISVSSVVSATDSAYGVKVTDDLPASLRSASIRSAIVSDGALSYNVSGRFTINSTGDLTSTSSVDLLLNTNGSNDQRLTILIDAIVSDSVAPNSTIANAAIATWHNAASVQKPSYTATGAAPTLSVPPLLSVAKSIIAPASGAVEAGDTVTYQLETTLLEATTSNLVWSDTLPAGMSYIVGSGAVSSSGGMTINNFAASSSGQTLTFSASSVTNPGNLDSAATIDSDTFRISYQARVSPTVTNGATLVNSVSLSADNLTSDTNNTTTITVNNIPPYVSAISAPNISQAQFGQTSSSISLVLVGAVNISAASIDIGALTISGPQSPTLSGASVSPASSSTPLTATYTLIPPGGSWDDADNGTYTVTLVADQIYDTLGRAAVAAIVGHFTVHIDTIAPDTSITASPASPSNSASATFRFSGDDGGGSGVVGFACQLDGGGFTSCTSPYSYAGLSDGGHTFEVRATDKIGNTDSTPASFSWTIDTRAPSVTIEQASGQADPAGTAPIRFSVTFDEPVSGFGDSAADLALAGTAEASSASVTGSGAAYTVAVSGMTSNGTVIVTIPAGAAQDLAGNPNAASTSADNRVDFDSTVPVVTGIVRAGASPSNVASVPFTVTFSMSVTGVDVGDFAVTSSRLAGASVTDVRGSGSTWTVIVGTGSGDGSLRLDLLDDDSIVSGAGIPLGEAGAGNGSFSAGDTYTIDKTAPSASGLAAPAAVLGGTGYSFTLVLSDNLAISIASLGAGDIRVAGPGGYSQLATLAYASPTSDGAPRSAAYQITPPGGAWDGADNGTYTVTLEAGQVLDTAGNAAGAATLGTFQVRLISHSYLPLLAKAGQPDLVAKISLSPDRRSFAAGEPVQISVTVTNQGSAASGGFWVDLYINPVAAPNAANILWNQTCALTPCYGIAWAVAGPLAPGASVTLSSEDAAAGYTIWPGGFAAGTTDLYAYADSWDPGVASGAVPESAEGNNSDHIGGLSVSGPNPAASGAAPGQIRARPGR